MKNCRRPKIPETIPALIQLLNMPEHISYRTTLREPSSDFFQQALTVEGITIGVIFANLDLIAMFNEELRTVTYVGCDGTFKTTPSSLVISNCICTLVHDYRTSIHHFLSGS